MDFSNFYTLVLTIAIVVLILVLSFFGWIMSKQKQTDNSPKLQTTCPDHWTIVDINGKTYCQQPSVGNVNRGDDNASKMPDNTTVVPGYDSSDGFDFTNASWSSGGNTVCSKKKWADSHGIHWDTVTNANYC